ncbi:MAG: UDP-N-acetylmuramoyl-L-alanine--D-glutamate ligase, partial [Clostridia bacterium]|nr:UDP-N-acetylmuramoyl-L-alanine--D-glutamate ligase [Clostridia bacterium]
PVTIENGVLYVNDSKGTNPEATMRALEAFEEPIVLIAGGRAKGASFLPLAEKMRGRVKHLILLGEAAPLLEEAARAVGLAQISRVSSLAAAVARAREVARPGDVVLLSPACASWDMFANYEERGEVFKELVLRRQDVKEG